MFTLFNTTDNELLWGITGEFTFMVSAVLMLDQKTVVPEHQSPVGRTAASRMLAPSPLDSLRLEKTTEIWQRCVRLVEWRFGTQA